jgi:hypothetical protein
LEEREVKKFDHMSQIRNSARILPSFNKKKQE